MMHCQAAVAVTEISQAGEARREANRLAALAGLSEEGRGRASIVASELATNLARYAQSGEILLRTYEWMGETGLEILSIDRGPGMTNTARCLEDGFSSGGTAGNGLGAVRRLSNDFDLHSSQPQGTVVLSRIRETARGSRQPLPYEWGVMHRPAPHELICGDTWRITQRGHELSILVADGLGHGLQAAEAAQAAADSFESSSFDPPADLITRANGRLVGTRGAAVAIAKMDGKAKKLQFAGVGNIAGSLRHPPGAKGKGLVSHNGTVGVAIKKTQPFEYDCPPNSLLLLHSDGLQSRWSLEDYAGLVQCHPAVIAGVLYRDYYRGRDDVTVCVVRYSAAASF